MLHSRDSDSYGTTSSRPLGLAHRLRVETAELHHSTEDLLGIPGSVTDVARYGTLLATSLAFYSGVQHGLEDAGWAGRWDELGIDIRSHDRTELLRADLRELGRPTSDVEGMAVDIAGFPAALGWLYVVEGSALGGRFIAPAIIVALGPVPTRFYRGEGREHPAPWRSVQAALATFDSAGGDADAVIAGAVAAFETFRRSVSVHSESREAVTG